MKKINAFNEKIRKLVIIGIATLAIGNTKAAEPVADWMSGEWGVSWRFRADDRSLIDLADPEALVSQVKNISGVRYVIFNLSDAAYGDTYIAPHSVLTAINPTATPNNNRDLFMEMAEAFQAEGIKVIVYMATQGPAMLKHGAASAHDKVEVSPGVFYSQAMDNWANYVDSVYGDTDEETHKTAYAEVIVDEYAARYSTLIDGWWFDHASEGNIPLLHDVVTAHNPNTVVTFNYGQKVPLINNNPDYEDYTFGHPTPVVQFPTSDLVNLPMLTSIEDTPDGYFESLGQKSLGHMYMPMGTTWNSGAIVWSVEQAADWKGRCLAAGGAWTWNVGFDSQASLLNASMVTLMNDAYTEIRLNDGWDELVSSDFEANFGDWVDGGVDAMLSFTNPIGGQCVRLRDNSGDDSSIWLANSLDLTGTPKLQIEFTYRTISMEANESFHVQFSDDGGVTWTTVKTFVSGSDFENHVRENPTLILDSDSYNFTSNVKIKFQCDASGDGDNVYIDNIIISADKIINGVPASWLETYGLGLTEAATLADTDGDGIINLDEYLASTNPLVNQSPPEMRVTEYYLTSGDFTETTKTLQLNQNLAPDYFILVRGSHDGNGLSMPDNDYVRVTGVPFGKGDMLGSGSSKKIVITRSAADLNWEGVVTVVECLNSASAHGFKTVDILSTNLNGTSGTDTSGTWTNIDQVTLFGGYRGGGANFIEAPTSRLHGTSVYTRLYPTGSNQIMWERDAGGETLYDAVMTTFVIEWGSEWKVQHVNVAGAAGGNGANATGEYITASIDAVNRDNSWIWGTGMRLDAGIGDSAEASLVTLGNGVSQNATENTVAVGSEYSDGSDFDVYVMTHADLSVDHRFKADGNSSATDLPVTVDGAVDGARFGWSYNGCNGVGDYFPRPRMWTRYTANGEITISRGYSGQNFPAWVQGIDFSGLNN